MTKINEILKNPGLDSNHILQRKIGNMNKILTELRKRDIPKEIINEINLEVQSVDTFRGSDKELRKQLRKVQNNLLKIIHSKLKLVTRNHYRNMWMAIGLAVFGIPMGVAIGFIIDNIGLLGIGLPFGFLFGLIVGNILDKKAIEEDRQLPVDIDSI